VQSEKSNPFKKKVTYLNAAKEDLEELNISQWRINIANFMRSKPVDIFIIALILLYTLLVIVYLAIEDLIDDDKTVETTLQIVELVFLFIFWVEITLNLIGFGILFLKDYWNIADITVILLAIAFVILDMTLDDSSLSGVFRLRGLFRLLRVGILIRKFDAIRKKSAARKQMKIRDIYHVSSPAEIVNEILCEVRDLVHNDDRLVEDLNYCIKMVSSGKLYETNILDDDGGDDADGKRKDALSWVKSIQGKESQKRRSSENPNMVKEKIAKINIDERLCLTSESKKMLSQADSLDFDIFEFKEAVEENELFVISSYLMQKHNLFENCNVDPEKYFQFIKRIQDHYNPNSIEYHNKTHGADVCQTSYFFLEGCTFRMIGNLSDFEMMAIIVSTWCHDFEHPGFNNFFLVESKSPWAIEYNDKSPLENHHIAATFKIAAESDFNIFKYIDEDEYKIMRKNMIEIVLATDAAHHFNELSKFKSRVGADDFTPDGDDKLMVIKMMVHLADISNPVKPFNLALTWNGLLYDEFFKQGDQEDQAGRNISFLMDRKTVNIASSSIGFCNMLVLPAYEALAQVIPEADIWLQNLESNISKWTELKGDFENRKNSGKNYIEESRNVIKFTENSRLLTDVKEINLESTNNQLAVPSRD